MRRSTAATQATAAAIATDTIQMMGGQRVTAQTGRNTAAAAATGARRCCHLCCPNGSGRSSSGGAHVDTGAAVNWAGIAARVRGQAGRQRRRQSGQIGGRGAGAETTEMAVGETAAATAADAAGQRECGQMVMGG